jgi:hypothetical protein
VSDPEDLYGISWNTTCLGWGLTASTQEAGALAHGCLFSTSTLVSTTGRLYTEPEDVHFISQKPFHTAINLLFLLRYSRPFDQFPIGILELWISPSQGHYLHRTIETQKIAHIHTSNEIRNHDPSGWAICALHHTTNVNDISRSLSETKLWNLKKKRTLWKKLYWEFLIYNVRKKTNTVLKPRRKWWAEYVGRMGCVINSYTNLVQNVKVDTIEKSRIRRNYNIKVELEKKRCD